MTTYAYLRVSTIDQNTEKNKLDVLKFANDKKLGNVDFVEEQISGKSNFKLDVNGAFLSNVWETTVETYHSRLYDTQKPKELLERIIKTSSNEGDVVVDFFCGSGTTLVVAKELNRNYIGCDINPRAIEITKQRLDRQ